MKRWNQATDQRIWQLELVQRLFGRCVLIVTYRSQQHDDLEILIVIVHRSNVPSTHSGNDPDRFLSNPPHGERTLGRGRTFLTRRI
jgi:hypothetical protein